MITYADLVFGRNKGNLRRDLGGVLNFLTFVFSVLKISNSNIQCENIPRKLFFLFSWCRSGKISCFGMYEQLSLYFTNIFNKLS